MLASIKPFIALYTSVLFLMTGVGLLNTYLGLRLSLEGVSTQVTGIVLTAYFLGLTLGTFFCRPMIRRVGHIRSFTAFGAMLTCVVMCHDLYMSPLLWGILRFVAGVVSIGLYTAIESWLNECSEVDFRGRIFSVYMVVTYLGTTIGQKLLGLGNVQDHTLFMISGIFIVLSIVPVATTRGIHPELPRDEQLALSTICRKAPLGLMGCFMAGVMQSGFYTMGPVFAHKIGMDMSQLSWFMALVLGGGLLLQWPVGMISDRFDRSLVLPLLGIFLAATAMAIVMFKVTNLPALMGGSVLFGGFLFALYPVAVARSHDLFDADDVVKVSSVLLLAYGIGSILGPTAASSVMTYSQAPGFFYFFIAGSLGFALVALGVRQKESVQIVPVEDQVDFVVMTDTSAVALHMDPRTEEDSEADSEADPEQAFEASSEAADSLKGGGMEAVIPSKP